MIPLKSEYHKHGLIQRVIERYGDIAIVEVYDGLEFRGCEVWIVQAGADREIGGTPIPASEFPPSSETWGSKGWTVANLNDARRKALEIKAKRERNAKAKGGAS